MKMCENPNDPAEVERCIKEVDVFVAGKGSDPYTMDEIKAIGTPPPKAIACERKM